MDNEFSSGCDTLESMSQHGSSGPRSYSLKYLKEITKGFSEKIGEGGFGTVYKGWLPNGGTVAVKKVNSLMLPGVTDKQFENEANHLKMLNHPNIVLLVGWCSETEHIYVEYNGKHICAEKLERLLCLEYMPNGDLRQHLKDESSRLTWETRYKIIKGICYGLHYLHEESQLSPIVHMDLKPANILLDNNMVPKIADFGLSRLFSEEKTKTSTINCNGTLGYMPPEYIDKGIISKKADIFSLGVIIIEIVTGHRDYPDGNGGISSAQFTELVLKNWRNRLQKSLEIEYQQIRRCIQTGLDCVKFDRSERPTISQVIKMLQETESAVQSHPTHNGGFSKGKKRERSEQGVDPAKRHRDRLLKVDDSEPGNFNLNDIKSKIAKITEKRGLPNAEAVEKLVHLMQSDRTEQKIDLSGRVIIADVIAATESPDCLGRFVQSRGLPVLDSWLQEASKICNVCYAPYSSCLHSKICNVCYAPYSSCLHSSSPKKADKPIDELLLGLLRALAKLPINLSALQSCSIGKSVNHLRSHKNLEIQKKAKCIVENWKKRIDAEMKALL